MQRYFAGKGVDASRVVTEGRGEGEPAKPNTTPANISRNRRVEFDFKILPAPVPLP